MSEILLYYRRPDPITWVYLSSFLTIGLYFVFHRFWSIRNLDIALLILLAPGLLMVHEGNRRELSEASLRASLAVSEATAASRPTNRPLPLELAESASKPTNGPAGLDTDSENESVQSRSDSAAISVKNLVAVVQGSPANDLKRRGFIWLFLIEFFLLVRMLLDPLMVRRPLLDPNLTTGGLNFIGVSLFIFIMANVVASTPRIQEVQGPKLGPGYALMNMLPAIPTRPPPEARLQVAGGVDDALDAADRWDATIAKILAIAAHIAIVVGIVLVGKRHYSNLRAGTGCAFLYLLLPYTAQMTGRVDHAVPAALLLWAVLAYRRPMVAGIFLGLAAGLVYYPLFLLPLWISFYWQRGARRFSVGVASMLVLLMGMLAIDATEPLTDHLRRMYGLLLPTLKPNGIWALGWNPIWRLPVIVGFIILSAFFASWPSQKNLGTLLNGSATMMIAAQFWHGDSGGTYIAWFLPLVLLTIFRPNLQDRVALKVIEPRNAAGRPTRPEVNPV